MDKLINWFINLGNGILENIIASILITMFLGWLVVQRRRRKTKINIQKSKIKGDVVGGDKTDSAYYNNNLSEYTNSHIKVSKSEISGDVIAGNKEK